VSSFIANPCYPRPAGANQTGIGAETDRIGRTGGGVWELGYMGTMETKTGSSRESGESEKERLDRNFQELLQGLRVALPGVQVLFAFLLVVPFQQGYADVTDFQQKVYFGTLMCTAMASACLIAPPVRHRLLFRQGVKDWILFNSNSIVQIGFVFLAVAICGVILLISDFIYDSTAAVIATAVVGIALAWLWFASPLIERAKEGAERS
jgi:hypothetical protein